jgi:CRISPR-associated protein Csb2
MKTMGTRYVSRQTRCLFLFQTDMLADGGGFCRWRVQIARYVPIIVIEFLKPVSGPIAVGYGAHFGLGLFVPV